MGVGNQTAQQVTTTVEAATSVNIINYNASTPATEYSQSLTAGVKSIIIRSRGAAEIKYCWTSGQSGTNYISIPGGATREILNIRFTGKTLYFQVSAADIVEIEEFY